MLVIKLGVHTYVLGKFSKKYQNITCNFFDWALLKVNPLKFRFMESLRHTASFKYIIWIFALIQQEAKHDQKKLSAEQK